MWFEENMEVVQQLFSRGKRDFFVQQTQQKTLISWFQRPSWLWKLIFYINHIRAESQGE